jgi:FKBP-type peptidyl-prolyl cis-trans isomerase
VIVTLAVATAAWGCGDDPFEVIEEVEFAVALGIDLSQMTKRPSGLYVQDLAEGTGDPAAVGQTAEVSYTGWLRSGFEFDSGQFPFTVGIGEVVAGFDEGVLGMKVGGVRKLVIPASLGYGAEGRGAVPPGAIMVFEVELVSLA